ncbi:hypothetical protein, conserved [Leishmania tarentolae]|uniref:Uncharacterized protein n=1 Tax=Leishmania tarentolae TaxID=5689 RepID=A0A640KQB6_LEITA|nr:hypothetical protein, conserved [Leishmania tarentolae]
MTTLPVLHLKATSRQNVTIATDLSDTTATLYTFLRSIPSAAEIELALQPFLESLHVAPSSGRAVFMRRPNHRLVQLMEAVAVDGVFRCTPQVLPALARHSDRWLHRLGYASKGNEATDSTEMMEALTHVGSGQQGSVPSPAAAPLSFMHVRAADMHQYTDPYSAYEAEYVGRQEASHSSHANASSNGGERLPKNESAAEPTDLQHADTTQPHQEASFVSAEVSALTVPGEESQLNEPFLSARHAVTPAPRAVPTSDTAIHPVLHLIANQVVQQQREADKGRGNAEEPAHPPSSDAVLEEKVRRLMERLDEAETQLTNCMTEKEEAEQVWSPYYSRLKTSRMYVSELKARVQSAASLFLLQRYECETLQQAHIGVTMESMSLQLVLRDVRARLEEQRSLPTDVCQQTTESERLVQQLGAVFAMPVEASQSSGACARKG